MQGAAQLASALPVGYLADKFSRSGIIKWGAALMSCAIGLTTYAVLASKDDSNSGSYALLAGALILWGVVGGIINGPAQALFADSLPTGTRSKFYNYLFSAYLVGASCGPLLAIILFTVWADEWSQPELRTVILVGMGLEFPCVVIMCFFSDAKALGKESEHVTTDARDSEAKGDDAGGQACGDEEKGGSRESWKQGAEEGSPRVATDPAAAKLGLGASARESRCKQCMASCGFNVASIP